MDRLRRRCAENVLAMSCILDNDIAPVHKQMAEAATRERALVLAPRGFGKSTLLSVVRSIYEIARNPDVRILLASNTQPQAEGFLREIRGHLERNIIFRALYGDLTGPKWTDREFIVGVRRRIMKEPTVMAIGVGGALISRHFDIIICDDIVDEENARTEMQRERLRTWFFKVLMPCLEPDGKLCIVGTRYHYRDLYGTLMESGFAPSVTIIRALDEQGRSTWPEKFPVERLEQIRRDAGTVIFNAQYQNDTQAMKGAVFKEEWLRYYDAPPGLATIDKSDDGSLRGQSRICGLKDQPRHSWDSPLRGCDIHSLKIFQGVDLSIAQHDGSDYFAIVTIGVDMWNNIFVLDCYQARLSFRQQTVAIVERFRRFDPIKVAIESNSYQAALADTLREMALVRVTKVHTGKDKLTRAWKLSALFEDGRIYLGRHMHELVEQLLAFPQAEHDDLFDALEFAISLSSSNTQRIRFF
jgi:predicted phage terminase large subunit-like protein